MFDIGLLHHLEELPGIGRQALDVTPLTLRVDGVEREGGFTRPRKAGDDRQRVARNLDVHALEIVLARPPYRNMS